MSLEQSYARQVRKYMSENQAADYGNLSSKTLQRRRADGSGPPFIKCGGRVLYDVVDFDHWMESQKVQSTSAYGEA